MKQIFIFVCVILVVIVSCARMIAPDGGSEDTIPPQLLSVSPEPGCGWTNIREVTFAWSERLDPQSVSVFIYPPLDFELEIHASEMVVLFRDDVTDPDFVLHIPTGISDTRGNTTDTVYDFIYSSSDVLPEGILTINAERQGGSVPIPGTLVELYAIENCIDSLLYRRTHLDSTGHAEVKWISPGLYRILCYEDLDNSFIWESDDEAGSDTLLNFSTSDSFTVGMYLSVVDTIGPRLIETEAIDSYHMKVSFNEDICTDGLLENVDIIDSTGTDVLLYGYWETGNRSGTSVILESGKIHSEPYHIAVSGVTDLFGNTITDDTLEFTGTDSLPIDSLRIRSYFPEPGGTGIDPAGPYYISFNYRIDTDSLGERFSLHRISDNSLVSGELLLMDSRSFKFIPDHQLLGEQQYVFELQPGLTTLWGDSLTEPFSWVFSTAWGDEPGSIDGYIAWEGSDVIVLRLSRTGGDSDNSTRNAALLEGDYVIDNIPPGRYTASAFVDSNSNEVWDLTEPYGTFPGVLLIQPGLTTKGVNIEILP